MLATMNIILSLIILSLLGPKLIMELLGQEKVVLKEKSPWVKDGQTENSLTISQKLTFKNEGSQCATFMDAMVRSQLPYEQYDGVEIKAKAEREGYPREDDYFEAVLIQKKGAKGDELTLCAKVCLTARKGRTLAEALQGMVDMAVDFIWQETGRQPWHYNKLRLTIDAAELRKLAGV